MTDVSDKPTWDDYDAAPIEIFHGEAMEQFHKGARFPVNETFVSEIRYMNGIEVNDILATFKVKIMKHYGISSSPTRKAHVSVPATFDEFESALDAALVDYLKGYDGDTKETAYDFRNGADFAREYGLREVLQTLESALADIQTDSNNSEANKSALGRAEVLAAMAIAKATGGEK